MLDSDQHWVKSLIINPELRFDDYFRERIRELIRVRLREACLGKIFVQGNFQVLVSDPYGFMQHACGHEDVTGLLGPNEFYSHYWNERDTKLVDGMRSPLTYRSEHVLMPLVNNDETAKWYQYCDQGIIVNYHGHEVNNWGGADFDYDILATTDNKTILDSVFTDELTVTYDPPKTEKSKVTPRKLYIADKFSFGTKIGAITNKSTSAYALLPIIEEKYGKDSDEYRLLISRLQQCCKAQSAQIDKSKIGRKVKDIPDAWLGDSDTSLTKQPYFFTYLYKSTRKKYRDYIERADLFSQNNFGLQLDELLDLSKECLNKPQRDFLDEYEKDLPVIHSKSSMNLLCYHIEKFIKDIDLTLKRKNRGSHNFVSEYSQPVSLDLRNNITSVLKDFNRDLLSVKAEMGRRKLVRNKSKANTYKKVMINGHIANLKIRLRDLFDTDEAMARSLINVFYVDNNSFKKKTLWHYLGGIISSYLLIKKPVVFFPFYENGEYVYDTVRIKGE